MVTKTKVGDKWAFAIDVGGTKVAANLIDTHGRPLLKHSVEERTKRDASLDEFLETVAQMFESLTTHFTDERAEVVAFGAAVPGPYRRDSDGELIVFPPNLPGLSGIKVVPSIRRKLGLDGAGDNDIKLATMGEFFRGSLRGVHSAIGLVHATGVSTATITHDVPGLVLRGPHNNGGEMGSLIVTTNVGKVTRHVHPESWVGHRLEEHLSGPGLAVLLSQRRGQTLDPTDTHAVWETLSSANQQERQDVIDYCVSSLAPVLAPMIQQVSADRVLLFGGVVEWLDLDYARRLNVELNIRSPHFRDHGSVVIAENLEFAPLLAAAHLAFQKVGITMSL